MSWRLGGYFFLLSGRNQQISGGISGIICFIAAFFAPPPRVKIVNGVEVREMLLAGHVVPKWLAIAILIPIIGLIHWGVKKLIDALWPEDKLSRKQATQIEKVFAKIDGSSGLWQPEMTEESSPIAFTPFKLSADATALEYLTCPPPPETRTLLRNDRYQIEYGEHLEMLEKWLASAPLEVLKDILPTAEELLAKSPLDRDLLDHLVFASRRFQVPTPDEVRALVGRLAKGEVLEYSPFDLPD